MAENMKLMNHCTLIAYMASCATLCTSSRIPLFGVKQFKSWCSTQGDPTGSTPEVDEWPLVVEFFCHRSHCLHLIAHLAGPSGFVVLLSWWFFCLEVITLEMEVGQLGAISDGHRRAGQQAGHREGTSSPTLMTSLSNTSLPCVCSAGSW